MFNARNGKYVIYSLQYEVWRNQIQ